MLHFFEQLKERNEPLYYFGFVCLILGILFLGISFFSTVKVANSNAWFKPFKFAISIAAYSWTMCWYCHYIKDFNRVVFSATVILLLGFEIVYIAIQAARGQLSHFNLSTRLYATLYSLMAVAATGVALYTAYIGILFMKSDFPELSPQYVSAIRWGILIFVIFSLEGFVMGARLSHTIGGPDGGSSIPLLNWSTRYGDPRIAHFIGMHALQVLPFVACYWLRSSREVTIVALLYLCLAGFTLFQALQGRPLIKA
jgi:hypothetical protein